MLCCSETPEVPQWARTAGVGRVGVFLWHLAFAVTFFEIKGHGQHHHRGGQMLPRVHCRGSRQELHCARGLT